MNGEIASGWILDAPILMVGIVAHCQARLLGRWNTITQRLAIALGLVFSVGYFMSGANGTFIPIGMTVAGVTLASAAFHWVKTEYIRSVVEACIRRRDSHRGTNDCDDDKP